MSTKVFPRSAWTSAANKAPAIKMDQTEIYIHYPGQPGDIGRVSMEATASRLRGYRAMHVAGQYSEIAYNWAVDQDGRIFELRGKRQCGGNGGTTTNRRGQAILVLVGNREEPTQDCIEGVRACVAMIREWQPKALKIRGHRDSFEANTDCPGDIVYALVKRGVFEPIRVGNGGASVGGGSTPAAKPAPAKPAKPRRLDEDGRLGTDTISELQRRLGVTVDGRAAEATWEALQEFLGAPYVDGIISRQSYTADEMGNGVVPRAWEHTGRGSEGSQTVKLLQAYVGAPVDGIWYEGTTKRAQILMNAYPAAFTKADKGVAAARAKKAGL